LQRQYQLHPSQYLAAILTVVHSATIAAFIPLYLPLLAKFLLAAVLLISLGYQLAKLAWLTAPSSSIAIKLEGDQILLSTRNGEQLPAIILRDSLVTPYLTVLNIKAQGTHVSRSIIILPDSLDKESFRQLRVWLKWAI